MAIKQPRYRPTGLPEPKTQRGRDTREAILSTARHLASERWVDDIPFTDLAEAAQVARASLLHAFGHWRNILWDLFEEEADLLDAACERARRRRHPGDRVFAMLSSVLDRAEETGLLYANLRAAMLGWRGEPTNQALFEASPSVPLRRDVLAAWARIRLYKHYVAVEELLGRLPAGSLKDDEALSVPIGECLVNFAFDLAAGSPTHFSTLQDRRGTLRECVDSIAAGFPSKKVP